MARLVAPGGLAAAALGATSLSSALLTGATTAVAPSVDLLALITPANSTAQIIAGTTYYGTDYTEVYGPQEVVPFFLGPQGIADAISAHEDDVDPTGVTASGWGAGQTGTALEILANNADEDDLSNVELVILDNNSNRGGGGFWTTYSPFAPLLLTSSAPTPSDLNVPILDVAYEYNINSSAPVDPLNPFALGNSLMAYVYGYGGEQTAEVPDYIIEEAKNPQGDHYHYVLDSEGDVVERIDLPGSTTTYVTFEADGLPLVRPLRLLPGGDIIADALEPTLTELVNAGYADGKGVPGDEAIPVDPRTPRTMQPGSSLTALGGVPESIGEGFGASLATAEADLSDPTNFVTKPIDEAATLPLVPTLVDQPDPGLNRSASVDDGTEESAREPESDDDTSTTRSSTPVKRFTDRLNDAVKRFTGAASGGAQDDANDADDDKANDAPADDSGDRSDSATS
ncbi:PE-PPE domain-containing protein [Mycobacterium sp. PS03-16]|uniref:PE-PPE domain-containing protein n=1 Tax=Mycobacterium sp. PS03-16 TaxID=2559611 RepID=UPI001FD74582|nr:PE-PPE domain-containing protein [Mycobacterium sp. PS03-16]